jgi:hypothetical protein
MTRFISALGSAVVISGAALAAQAQAPAITEVNTLGCIRLWTPSTGDPTKMPSDRHPGLAGVYLLTPLASNGIVSVDLPTYVLTPSATLSFSQHVGRQVAIAGTAQPALSRGPVAIAPPLRPENRPSTDGMPRLTVSAMRQVSESCP